LVLERLNFIESHRTNPIINPLNNMDIDIKTHTHRVLPSSQNEDDEKRPQLGCNLLTGIHFVDFLERGILYPLCAWTYMDGVDGLKVTNPDQTAPKGCLVRAVTFVSNPGSYVNHLELRYTEELDYHFYLSCSKSSISDDSPTSAIFSRKDWDMDQLVFLYLRILSKWEKLGLDKKPPNKYGYVDRDLEGARNHLNTFKRRTRVRKGDPSQWTSFDTLLHYVVLSGANRKVPPGWSISWESGDHFVISKYDYGSPIRGPVSKYLDGVIQSRYG
jgi:hypothetical protein